MGDDKRAVNVNAPVRSVARAVDLLMALSAGGQSLGHAAEKAGLSKATAHRLLASLGHQDLVIQDPSTGNYLLGPGCFVLSEAVLSGVGGVGHVARPALETLRNVTRESVTIHIRAGAQRICIEELVSPHDVRYTAGVGASHPIHTGSAGKVLLAFLPAQTRSELIKSLNLEALTESTITDRSILEKELDEIARRGFAESRGERVQGAAATSAPVFSPDGKLLCAVSVLGPSSRLTDGQLREIRPYLLKCAAEIEATLAALDRSLDPETHRKEVG